jgi:hypothetical protein
MTTHILLTLIAALQIALHYRLTTTHNHFIEHIDRKTNQLSGVITLSTQDTINAVTAQLKKVKDELLAKIADLNVQIEDANVADVVDTSELTAAAQALDDIVPDPEPATEPSE